MKAWYLYILDCDGRAFYTGVSTDPQERIETHRSGTGKAAKFTRGFTRIDLVYQVQTKTKQQALQMEYALKQQTRQTKKKIVTQQPNLPDLLNWLGLEP